MSPVREESMFSMLPSPRPPWWKMVLGMSAEAAVVIAIAWLLIIKPIVYEAPKKEILTLTLVDTPPPVNHAPQPIRKLPPPPVEEIKQALKLPAPVIPKPKVEEEVQAPKVKVAENRPVVDIPAPKIPRELVKTNVFTTGSSAPPTIARAPEKIQTGGFGDPNGLPAQDAKGKPTNIAKLGSFDLPNGGGMGNGTGGDKGIKGVVASSGFGSGVAQGDNSGKVSGSRVGGVRSSGFGDTAAPVAKAAREVAVAPRTTPVEVLSKPTPVYTEEGKKLKIEGEVLLEVSFEAAGKVRVIRIVRGLGHGLDEAAVRAAEQIHFKPATRDGQPADSSAVLHIVFQLA